MRTITIRNVSNLARKALNMGSASERNRQAAIKAANEAALRKRFKGLVIYAVLFYGTWQIHPAIATSLWLFAMVAAMIEVGVLAVIKAKGKD